MSTPPTNQDPAPRTAGDVPRVTFDGKNLHGWNAFELWAIRNDPVWALWSHAVRRGKVTAATAAELITYHLTAQNRALRASLNAAQAGRPIEITLPNDVRRCELCAQWRRTGETIGVCLHPKLTDSRVTAADRLTATGDFETGAQFGCVHWAPKMKAEPVTA